MPAERDERLDPADWVEALALLVMARDALKVAHGVHTTSSVIMLVDDFLEIHLPDEEDPFS